MLKRFSFLSESGTVIGKHTFQCGKSVFLIGNFQDSNKLLGDFTVCGLKLCLLLFQPLCGSSSLCGFFSLYLLQPGSFLRKFVKDVSGQLSVVIGENTRSRMFQRATDWTGTPGFQLFLCQESCLGIQKGILFREKFLILFCEVLPGLPISFLGKFQIFR